MLIDYYFRCLHLQFLLTTILIKSFFATIDFDLILNLNYFQIIVTATATTITKTITNFVIDFMAFIVTFKVIISNQYYQ